MTLYSRFFNKYNTVVNFSGGKIDYVLSRNLPTDAKTGLIADPWITPNDMYDAEDIGFRGKPGASIPDEFDIWGDPVPKGYPVSKPITPPRPQVQPDLPGKNPYQKALASANSNKGRNAVYAGLGGLALSGAALYGVHRLTRHWREQSNKKQERR